jgi:hypothetical protein
VNDNHPWDCLDNAFEEELTVPDPMPTLPTYAVGNIGQCWLKEPWWRSVLTTKWWFCRLLNFAHWFDTKAFALWRRHLVDVRTSWNQMPFQIEARCINAVMNEFCRDYDAAVARGEPSPSIEAKAHYEYWKDRGGRGVYDRMDLSVAIAVLRLFED